MADSFLVCDNMKIHPTKDTKKEPQQMIVLSTDALATDNSSRLRHIKPPMPKMCCIMPVNVVAIFGVASTSMLSSIIYVICLVHLLKTTHELNTSKIIALLSVAEAIILLFTAFFVWGLFAGRQRFLLPFTTLSCFLLFPVVGTLIATIVMSGDEFKTALAKSNGDNNGSSVADLVIFRVALGVISLVLAIEVYAYIRLYLYLKSPRRIPSR
ncbi:hypothetical protein KIN20_002716 [Parelaphostrongylus tenuis]|uniref:Uncharacterized protein n=1 Tax=Parelaphostrongylus tenuis TaxID=148309 RepID=A0AAD5MEL3_PARTN|nr:hypothetical protein KIN20_002716 [Parelaphostrongylus tenuis]